MMAVSDEEFEKTLRADFLAEATELLGRCEAQLLDLERGAVAAPTIDALFRQLHTIKGSAAVAGCKELSSLAHILETLLSRVRSQEMPLAGAATDALLAGVDAMQGLTLALRTDPAALCPPGVIEALTGALAMDADHTTLLGNGSKGVAPLEDKADKTAQDAGPRRRRILIVEDDALLLECLVEQFAELRCELITAANGLDALTAWERDKGEFDLIVSDQHMPGCTGAELLAKVRQSNERIPAIIVSGATQRSDAVKFMNLRVYAFFEKPWDQDRLISAAKTAIRVYEQETVLAAVSNLMIRSYLTARRIAAKLAEEKNLSLAPNIDKFSALLQHIGLLINQIKRPEF